MIRSYYRCCCINELVNFHCVHLKQGHRFHALLKVCSDCDSIVPLNVQSYMYDLLPKNFFSKLYKTPTKRQHWALTRNQSLFVGALGCNILVAIAFLSDLIMLFLYISNITGFLKITHDVFLCWINSMIWFLLFGQSWGNPEDRASGKTSQIFPFFKFS